MKDDVKEVIRRHAEGMTDPELAAEITRVTGRTMTAAAAGKARQRLGIRKRTGGQGRAAMALPDTPLGLTASQIESLRRNAARMTDEELAAVLGRGVAATKKARQRLGIRKKRGRGLRELD